MNGTLTLLCGLPGAGKTTLAHQLEESDGALRLTVDEWISELELDFGSYEMRRKVELLQLRLAADSLNYGRDVVLDWGFWHREQRDHARHIASSAGAKARLVVWTMQIDDLWARVKARNNRGQSPAVTREQLEAWKPYFEEVLHAEAQLFDEVQRRAS